jgi:hypothetical protein
MAVFTSADSDCSFAIKLHNLQRTLLITSSLRICPADLREGVGLSKPGAFHAISSVRELERSLRSMPIHARRARLREWMQSAADYQSLYRRDASAGG